MMKPKPLMWCATVVLLSLAYARAQLASELDEALLQQMLDELTVREETSRLQAALAEEARLEQENNGPQAAEEPELDDPERMFRYRKEGQISVYNYGPSIRDQEYLEHSSLWGHQYVAGGAGEGIQRLKPDGSSRNVQVVKSDAVLPAYCNPPNPCPIGYTSEDGCLEEFENTAAFSRSYQSQQECLCDSEHMFDCPGASKDDEVNTLARQISNEGLMESALDRIAHHLDGESSAANDGNEANAIPVEGQHKSLVAKKFFNKETHADYTRSLSDKNRQSEMESRGSRVRREAQLPAQQAPKVNDTAKVSVPAYKAIHKTKIEFNPYLQGEKLPVVAKKG